MSGKEVGYAKGRLRSNGREALRGWYFVHEGVLRLCVFWEITSA